ncbi:hypothetical protein TSUD_182530 [Trifolium subterraneum]|uniref:XS domain-containing protein n=1 Tax=Trifolium subterraneum TaxID=3900 RepID=A0A2Z6LGL2_TRISU|nr:hypothetical protein TSUD_182530 [Trifolium subterraneum]
MNITSKDYYESLRKGLTEFQWNKEFKCPFCWSKSYGNLEDVLDHAKIIVNDKREKPIEISKHRAVLKCIQNLDLQDKISGIPRDDDSIVWPWTVILSNIRVGLTDKDIEQRLQLDGVRPSKVVTVWNRGRQTEFAIVVLGKERNDHDTALKLERSFKEEYHGKKDYDSVKHRGHEFFGWMARVDDYEDHQLGNYLQDHTTLISNKEAEMNKDSNSRYNIDI